MDGCVNWTVLQISNALWHYVKEVGSKHCEACIGLLLYHRWSCLTNSVNEAGMSYVFGLMSNVVGNLSLKNMPGVDITIYHSRLLCKKQSHLFQLFPVVLMPAIFLVKDLWMASRV